jgi:class 3 adenylate cyclase
MAIAALGLAETYQASGDMKNALISFLEAEGYARETAASYSLEKIYSGLSAVYASRHDFIKAFEYQTKLNNVKDEIYNLETDKKLGTLQFTFDLQKKESEISLLTADKKNKDLQLAKERIVRNGFVGGFAVMVLFAGIFFRQRNRISKEKKRSDELLLNILPEETAEELKETGKAQAKSYDLVTVMFTDFKNFTQASERLTPEELVEEINHCYSEFDRIVTRHGIEKIKTIGDAYMCVGGLPVPNQTHALDVVQAGLEFQTFIAENKKAREARNEPFFELRLGIHTGPVVAGIVGIKKFAYDIWGDTVNTASRMESSGETGKVNISGFTYELVKNHFRCHHRGKVKAKNKGEIDMYFVEGRIA